MTLKKTNTIHQLHAAVTNCGEGCRKTRDMLNAVSVFDHVLPEDITKEQCKDTIHGVICPYVTAGEKLKSLVISKILKAIRKYLM